MTKLTIENGRYSLDGLGLGCWAKSEEYHTVVEGEVRVIGKVLMYAYKVYRPKWFEAKPDIVWWTPVDDSFNTFENLSNWKKSLL